MVNEKGSTPFIVLVVILLIVVFGGGYYYYTQNNQPTYTTPSPIQNFTPLPSPIDERASDPNDPLYQELINTDLIKQALKAGGPNEKWQS